MAGAVEPEELARALNAFLGSDFSPEQARTVLVLFTGVCCRVLPCVAVCCGVLQCVAVCYNVLQ